jgi:uncharacterized protein YndB with AHSA1/START domain
MDFRVGGKEHTRFRIGQESPVKGLTCANDTVYHDIVPNARVVFSSRMAIAERCISASLVTVEFWPSGTGTDLVFTHQGAFFEGADGPEMREEGWRKLLEQFAEELLR